MGSAGKVWLHESLNYLNEQLDNKLLIFKGDPQKIFEEIFNNFNVKQVCWNRCYEP